MTRTLPASERIRQVDAHETTPSDAAKPFDLDPSRNRMRADFEHWYICHAFDYQRDPIGSEKCSLQWQAWKGAREIEQGRGALPELPEPEIYGFMDTVAGCIYLASKLGKRDPDVGLYFTKEQMTAYGEACLRMGNRDE